jgi:hypothetical protein
MLATRHAVSWALVSGLPPKARVSEYGAPRQDRNTCPRVGVSAACHIPRSRASTRLCIGIARTLPDLAFPNQARAPPVTVSHRRREAGQGRRRGGMRCH